MEAGAKDIKYALSIQGLCVVIALVLMLVS
jgi:hypothetical protein